MQIIEINPETKIELYGSIKELPVRVSKEFKKYFLQDTGIGSDMEDIDEHLHKLVTFAAQKDPDAVAQEATNLRFAFFAVLEKWDFRSLSFACLVKSVWRRTIGSVVWDKTPVTDYTSQALTQLIDQLSSEGLTVGMVEDLLADLKKNLIPNAGFISRNSLETT